jgi:hypothetical protein
MDDVIKVRVWVFEEPRKDLIWFVVHVLTAATLQNGIALQGSALVRVCGPRGDVMVMEPGAAKRELGFLLADGPAFVQVGAAARNDWSLMRCSGISLAEIQCAAAPSKAVARVPRSAQKV